MAEAKIAENTIERFTRAFTKPWMACLLCLAASFLVYAPALGGDLIWDDFYLVRENPFFRSPVFGVEVFRHYLFFDSFSTYYRPIQNCSYMLDYWLWHGSPFGYHCTNIVIHGFCGFLLYLLLRRLLPSLAPKLEKNSAGAAAFVAFLVALIWTVHPMHNAAVAYISGRADSLAALFALSAWLLLLRALDEKNLRRRLFCAVIAAGSVLLALCSKEIALVWLLLFLVHFFAFDRDRSWRTKWTVLAGIAALFGVYAILHAQPGYRAPMEDGPPPAWDARVLLMLRALGDYWSLLLYPGHLYMERTISDPAIYRTVTTWRDHVQYEYLSVFGLLAILLAVVGCRKRDDGRPWRIFGITWFALAFLPISNLFPLNAEVAEHWIYLASVGFLIFLAGVLVALPRRGQIFCAWMIVPVMAVLGLRTAVRSGDWIDGETFCARTIAAGGATPRILSSLAAIYSHRGDLSKEENVLRKLIAGYPEFAPARQNLAICLSRQGRNAEAETLLGVVKAHAEQISRQYPRTWPAAVQLAFLRRDAGHPDEALVIIREARQRFPEIWELVKAESELVRETSGPQAATPLVADFAATHWWHYDAQSTLGALRFAAGDSDGAIAAFRAASRLDIYDGRALAGVAEIENTRGRSEVALEVQLEAMDRDPNQPTHYAELALILDKLGRKAEANAALHMAQSLGLAARKGS